jgi:hypothetical protein
MTTFVYILWYLKVYHHDIAEILLKVALNTKNQNQPKGIKCFAKS